MQYSVLCSTLYIEKYCFDAQLSGTKKLVPTCRRTSTFSLAVVVVDVVRRHSEVERRKKQREREREGHANTHSKSNTIESIYADSINQGLVN